MENIKNLNTIVESPTAHSGKNVSRIDSGKDFGLIYTYNIPDSLVGKQLAVSVNAWVKSGNIENPGDLICSITNSRDSIMMWNGFGSKNVLTAPNQWANLTSTLTISKDITSKANITISVIAFNSGKSYFEVDDLNISYFELNNP
ncbi:MAG: hypothetical protein ACXVP0_01470 [Bacteroidia bacterium]